MFCEGLVNSSGICVNAGNSGGVPKTSMCDSSTNRTLNSRTTAHRRCAVAMCGSVCGSVCGTAASQSRLRRERLRVRQRANPFSLRSPPRGGQGFFGAGRPSPYALLALRRKRLQRRAAHGSGGPAQARAPLKTTRVPAVAEATALTLDFSNRFPLRVK